MEKRQALFHPGGSPFGELFLCSMMCKNYPQANCLIYKSFQDLSTDATRTREAKAVPFEQCL